MHFLEWKLLYIDSDFTAIHSKGFNKKKYANIALDNDLAGPEQATSHFLNH